DKNIKVINIPLVPEVPVPKELRMIDSRRIIGLTNSVDHLNQVRKVRLKSLGLSSTANYASLERILEETRYAEEVMKNLGCPIINVSDKAIEETATIILEILKTNGQVAKNL
ncbi:phosphotransferase, partial [Streptococcus agalactiae GB00897]